MEWGRIRRRVNELVDLGLTPMDVIRILDWVILVVKGKGVKP